MRKIFVALAVLGIVLGTVTLITPAVAYYGFDPGPQPGQWQLTVALI